MKSTQIQKLLLSLFASFITLYSLGQQNKIVTLIDETFADNSLNWQVSNQENLKTSINGGKYIIDLQSSSPWHRRIDLPEEFDNIFKNDEASLSFNLTMVDSYDQNSFGFGFTFDYLDEKHFNILYFGNNGRFFYSAIQKRDIDFGPAIKESKTLPFVQSKEYKIKISKQYNIYKIYVDGNLILSFTHKENIVFNKFYLTIGKYVVSNISAQKVIFEINSDLQSKEFKANEHNLYILLAGINKYPDKEFTDLNSPLIDIAKMKSFWQSSSGGSVKEQNIIKLEGDQAKRQSIRDNLIALAKKATKNDAIIVYLSGHGAFGGYFCCTDYLLAYSEISQILTKSLARNSLVIADACFSGYSKNIITPPTKGVLTEEQLKNMYYFSLSTATKNCNFLFSCDALETSYDGSENSNSLFTKALLEVLNSTENKLPGDIITLGEAYTSLQSYFNRWNDQHAKERHKIKILDNGIIKEFDVPVAMNPKLYSVTNNNINNFPLVIIK